jgi:REP element-mobilizing transposase RayT
MKGVTKDLRTFKFCVVSCFSTKYDFLSMANTFSFLNIHCVFSTKERVGVLDPDIRERLWPSIGGIAKQNGVIPKCIGGVSDHVHFLLTLPTRWLLRRHQGRIISLDSSNLSESPKLCLATGLWRIQRRYLAGSRDGSLHRAATRTSSNPNLSRRVFSLL